jgi:hypothetical protein
MRLGRPAGEFDLFDIYTFSQLPINRIDEPVVVKEWTEKIHEFNRV